MKHEWIDSETKINADPNNPSGVLVFLITEINHALENEADVIQYVHDISPPFLTFPVTNIGSVLPNTRIGVILRQATIPSWELPDCRVTVEYGQPTAAAAPAQGGTNPATPQQEGGQSNSEILGPEWEFDIGTETIHVTQLDETVIGGNPAMKLKYAHRMLDNGQVVAAPFLNGAIGVSGDPTHSRVEGMDIEKGKVAFSIQLSGLPVSNNYIRYLEEMVSTVNLTKFRNHEPEECRFMGASLRHKAGEGWNGRFSFEAGRNRSNVVIGGITHPTVGPFDYAWCTYKNKELTDGNGKKILLPVADCVYVLRKYPLAEFAGLFTGVG